MKVLFLPSHTFRLLATLRHQTHLKDLIPNPKISKLSCQMCLFFSLCSSLDTHVTAWRVDKATVAHDVWGKRRRRAVACALTGGSCHEGTREETAVQRTKVSHRSEQRRGWTERVKTDVLSLDGGGKNLRHAGNTKRRTSSPTVCVEGSESCA